MASRARGVTFLCYLILAAEMHLSLAIKSFNFTPAVLDIYEINIKSNIDNRYVRTTVVKKLENKGEMQRNITYSVVFPEDAYISSFILEVDGENYTAKVIGRTEDNKTEVTNESTSVSKKLKEMTQRDTNKFTLPVNVKPRSKIAFYLTYEQLLQRQHSRYEHIINLHTDQPIPFFNVEVNIAEKNSLTNLMAATHVCNENKCKNLPVGPDELSKHSTNKATIKPDLSLQKQNDFAMLSRANATQGFTGQFIVQYDIERNTTSGQILTNNGYCVHFFAPTNLSPISKYVVFILDTSQSMRNEHRLELLIDAMHKILEKLNDSDFFSIIEFNSIVKVWNLDKKIVAYPSRRVTYGPVQEVEFTNFDFPKAHRVNKMNIKKAKEIISGFKSGWQTNIYSALRVGLHLVELSQGEMYNNTKPFIVFLTDGQHMAQDNITNDIIVEKITEFNVNRRKSSIFTLAFGTEPDFDFLKRLAKHNSGFAKQIYDAADASHQLQAFYNLISAPVLSNVSFHYGGSTTNLTKATFPTVFNGTEVIVASECDNLSNITIEGVDANGKVVTFNNPVIEQTEADVKRTWVYVSISQLLEDTGPKLNESLKKAYDLALANSFATYVTSLVVPDLNNGITVVNPKTSKRGVKTYLPPPDVTPVPFIPKKEKHSGCSWSRSIVSLICISLTTSIIIFNKIVLF